MLDFYIIHDTQAKPGHSAAGLEYAGGLEDKTFENLKNKGNIPSRFDYYSDFRLDTLLIKQIRHKIMRIFLILLALSLGRNMAFASEQIPDYIIYGKDTLPLFANPLEQYFTLVGNRNIPDFKGECSSTACWRGYKAIWELKNDSLFLRQITSCHNNCGKMYEGNLLKMFGTQNVFASWYSGEIIIPGGKFFTSFNMGYSSIYEYEEHIKFSTGLVKGKSLISNLNLIENLKQEQLLHKNIKSLKDTLLCYLDGAVNWKKIENSNKDICCDEEYLLYYDSMGNLKQVKILNGLSDTLNAEDKALYHKLNKKCSEKFMKSLSQLSLAYLKPHRNFTVRVELFYTDKLEIWECELYYRKPSEKETSNWVEKQMTPR